MEQKPPLIVRLIPRRFVSRMTGWFARRRLPGFLLRPFLRWYARRYDADLTQAARPLAEYRSFVDFFTRTLKADARPLPEDPKAIACPCDGTVSMAGTVEHGTLLQVKGHTYSLAELLGLQPAADLLEGGTYVVLYLAPGDYHRFYWPFDGRVETAVHMPGDLWPVNERSVGGVERLFARNERVVCFGTVAGEAAFAYVPVGALNVGSIRLAFAPVRTNRWSRRPPASELPDVAGKRGDEFGWFELGSTIVLVLAPDAGTLDTLVAGTRVRMGQPIGRLS